MIPRFERNLYICLASWAGMIHDRFVGSFMILMLICNLIMPVLLKFRASAANSWHSIRSLEQGFWKKKTEHLFRKFQVIEYQSSEFSSGGLIHKNIVIGSENWRSGLSILTLIFRHSWAILWRYYHLEILKQLSHTAASLKFLFDSNFQNSDKKWKSA